MTSAITRVTATGVVTADGVEHPVDTIIFGTGFKVGEGMADGVTIIGRDGRKIHDVWAHGPEALLGTTVAGFPNLFMMIGPNTGLGHSSMVYMIESQTRYLLDALRTVDAAGAVAIDTRQDRQDAFNADLQRRFAGSVWTSGGCASWYLDAQGRNRTLWPGYTVRLPPPHPSHRPRRPRADRVAQLGPVLVYAIGLTTRFRRITVREGMLLEGPAGWGEFCPSPSTTTPSACRGSRRRSRPREEGWPSPVRDRVPVNAIVPAVSAEQAYALVRASGCGTAKVKVADAPGALPADVERVAAVRDALGPGGAVRVDANAAWDVDEAVTAIRALDQAAGGLEYVEQPCPTVAELAAVRRRVDVRIAADESIRRAEDPLRVAVAEAADVAVLKCAPLGGVRRALAVAEACGLPCVVSSALQTSVGLAAEIALAGALPELPFACGLGTGALFTARRGGAPARARGRLAHRAPPRARAGAGPRVGGARGPGGVVGGALLPGAPAAELADPPRACTSTDSVATCRRRIVARVTRRSSGSRAGRARGGSVPRVAVVVVGAGIAGIACARELAGAGVAVRVLERARVVGGRMASRRLHGRPVDLGAAYFTVADPEFAQVVDGWQAAGLARPWTDTLAVLEGGTRSARRRARCGGPRPAACAAWSPRSPTGWT